MTKIGALLYKYKCKFSNRVYYVVGWSSTGLCYERSPDAGKECIQNNDCRAGVCVPSALPRVNVRQSSFEWTNTPEVNKDGFILGECSEAALPFDPEYGGTCLSSYIYKPSTLDDYSGISWPAFCD